MYSDHSSTVFLDPAPPILRNGGPARRWRISDAAIAITGLVLLSFAIVMNLPWHPGNGVKNFTPEHVHLLRIVDTGAQRLAHRVSLVVLAALCGLGAVMIARPVAHSRRAMELLRQTGKFFRKWSGVFIASSAALVFVSGGADRVFMPPMSPRLFLEILALSICLTILGLIRTRHRTLHAPVWVSWSLVALYGLFLSLPGLLRTLIVYEPGLSWYEWHYSTTLAQADRLASGLRLGSQVNLSYGVIHTLIVAVIERNWGLLDFGAHVRLVQASQIIFLAVAILAFYFWRPHNPVFVLFAAFLVGPWVSTSHYSVFYPNQTGWRSLGLAVGVAILMMCRRSVTQAAWVLGAAACFLVLYNPETGTCLTLGYALFLLSRQRNLQVSHLCSLTVRAGAGAAIVLAGVSLLFRAGLGYWPYFDTSNPFGLISKFGQGYGGVPLYFDLFALMIFLHSTWIVGSTVLKWKTRNLEFEESAKLAISATILAWFAYFVNRPYAWNLWTYQFLYVFLLADVVIPSPLRRLGRRGIAKTIFDFRIAAMTFVVLPMALHVNIAILTATVSPERRPEVNTAMVSGLLMPEDSAGVIKTQAGFLASQAQDTLFFSCHSYSLSLLTKRFNPLPGQDTFAETITDSDFERLVAEINKISPSVMLFDAPSCQPESAENSLLYFFNSIFFDRLKRRLAGRYERTSVTSGWQVWRLRLPAVNSGILHEKLDPLG